MKRIIINLEKPIPTADTTDAKGNVIKGNPNPVQISHIPQGAISIATKDAISLDYLQDKEQAVPAEAVYVSQMDKDGTVTDLVGNADAFPHTFAGWDKKKVAPVEELPISK
jgi:hypothetical protein